MVFPEVLKVTVLRESKEQENFVLSVARHREICHSFENLKNEIAARCPGLLQSDEIKFFWIDDEGDEITIVNHADYFDYMDSCNTAIQKRRIYAKGVRRSSNETDPASSEEMPVDDDSEPRVEQSRSESLPDDIPVHLNVVCDVCDEIIKGHRYKCMQCFNYDLCMRCEGRYRHKDHMMIRIPTPGTDRQMPFRFFEKMRSFASNVSAQAAQTAATNAREEENENCKRSKRHHRRNSKDREESRERREEKERKERKHRRERSAKCAEERRSGRYGHGHFNFSHLINQVIDPANISAFLSADAAAAAAAAAAESAQEAARATMANCPLFSTRCSDNTGASFTCTSASASTSAQNSATATASATAEKPEEASAPSPSEEPQAKKAATSPSSVNQETQRDFDLSWLAPTPESIQKINQTFSKILDPLGMNIEIRSNGSAAKPAQTQTPTEEKMDKTTETANTPTTSTPSQTTPVAPAVTSNKSTEIDPIAELEQKLQAALLAEKLGQKSPHCSHSYDDDSSSVSSVSLLSDNEGAAEHGYTVEKKWTLVDLPCDEEQVTAEQTNATPPTAKPDTPIKPVTVPSASQEPSTLVTPPSISEAVSASSAGPITPIDYEQLGKALKQHLEAEKKAAEGTKTSSHEATPPPMEAPVTPISLPINTAIPLPPPPTIVTPSTHTAAPNPPTSTVGPKNASTNITYSSRPHVNRAVQTMLAMGFSNEGGWLAQLLESVNGDIPRALDLLTPHKINP